MRRDCAQRITSLDAGTGSGSASITLSGDPGSKNNTALFIGGVYQQKSTYSISGTTLTAGGTIASGVGYEVVWSAPLTVGAPSDGTVTTVKIGDSAVTTAKLASNAVTYAKMQNVSATSRILGRKTASAGDTEECTLSEVLDFIGSAAQGDILYRGASAWARLAAGTSGQYLQTQGAGANPQWASAGSGTAGKHAIYVAAGSMRPSVTGGCAALAGVASAANQPDIVTLDFDTTTEEYAQFGVVMPKSWNEGTVTFKAHWSHASTTTNFGVAWKLQGVAVSDDDAIAAAFGTAVAVTDTGGTTNDLYTTAESSAITIAGTPAAEDMVFFRVFREPSNGSDTMAVDARLHGVTLYITTNADTDA